MSKGAKFSATGRSNALRLAIMLALTAICSFTLGALYSKVHRKALKDPLATPDSIVEEVKPGAIPFFLKDSLSAVRQRVRGLRPGSLNGSIEVAVQQTTVSTVTTTNTENRKYIQIFIGIFTTAGVPSKHYDQRRKAIRETWLTKVKEFPEIEAHFVSGQSADPAMQASIEAEQSAHDDFIFLDMQECYTCLPQKTIAFLQMVATNYYAEWVIKMDDDVYLNPHRLRLAVHQWGRMRADYIGCMKHGIVHGDPKSKWFEPAQLLIGREYHMNAYGSIYVLNARVIEDVVIPNRDRLRLLANEDTSVGLWMSAFKVRFFEDMRLCSVRCHPAGVAFLDNMCSGLCNPIQDMYKAHKNINCRRLVKAPLPYMPSFRGHEAFHSMRVR